MVQPDLSFLGTFRAGLFVMYLCSCDWFVMITLSMIDYDSKTTNRPYLTGLDKVGSLVPMLFSADTRNSYSTSGSRSSTV